MASLKMNLLVIGIGMLTFAASYGLGGRLKQVDNNNDCDGLSFRCKNSTHYNRCRTIARVGTQRLTITGRRIFRCPLNRLCNDTGSYPCVIDENFKFETTTVLNASTTVSNSSVILQHDEEDSDGNEPEVGIAAQENIISNKPSVDQGTTGIGVTSEGGDTDEISGAEEAVDHGVTGTAGTGETGTGGDYTGTGSGTGGDYSGTGEDGSGDGDEDEEEEDEKCKLLGRKPNPESCTKYTLCIAGKGIDRECPGDQAFWGSVRACSRNWANCPLIGDCTTDGDLLPIPNESHSYLVCVKKRDGFFDNQDKAGANSRNSHFKLYKRSCAEDDIFDNVAKECVSDTEITTIIADLSKN